MSFTQQGYGQIQIFTGNGKGKTSAALGEVIRTIGAGKKVGIVYFDKGGSHYSERSVLDRLSGVQYIVTGRDRIDPITGRFDFSITQEDKEEGRRGLKAVEEMFLNKIDLVVMDEINSCVGLHIVDVNDVCELIQHKPEGTELILTGRNASKDLMDLATLVTEMVMQKHYYYAGVKAREGLDF